MWVLHSCLGSVWFQASHIGTDRYQLPRLPFTVCQVVLEGKIRHFTRNHGSESPKMTQILETMYTFMTFLLKMSILVQNKHIWTENNILCFIKNWQQCKVTSWNGNHTASMIVLYKYFKHNIFGRFFIQMLPFQLKAFLWKDTINIIQY